MTSLILANVSRSWRSSPMPHVGALPIVVELLGVLIERLAEEVELRGILPPQQAVGVPDLLVRSWSSAITLPGT